jgi:2-dehydropantoate 2-reductase
VRIAVIGAGAIGGALGALLQRAGQEVSLVGRPDQVAAIRRSGLRVDGVMGSFVAALPASTSVGARPDLALLTVKTQDVPAALAEHGDALGDAPVVAAQNGVRGDELAAAHVPHFRLLSAVVLMHATYLDPGRVVVLYPGGLVVGRPSAPRDSRVETIARVLGEAVPTRASDNVAGAHWLKLIVNLNNALPAITNTSARQVYEDGFLGRLGVRLMREGLRVVRRAGVTLEALPDMPLGLFRMIAGLPLPLAVAVSRAKLRRFDSGWPLYGSTLQSLRRGRPTEIDYLNGEIVRLAERQGGEAPLNRRIVELVHQVERTGRFLAADDVREAMLAPATSSLASTTPAS